MYKGIIIFSEKSIEAGRSNFEQTKNLHVIILYKGKSQNTQQMYTLQKCTPNRNFQAMGSFAHIISRFWDIARTFMKTFCWML